MQSRPRPFHAEPVGSEPSTVATDAMNILNIMSIMSIMSITGATNTMAMTRRRL